jgi:hypothetical protein
MDDLRESMVYAWEAAIPEHAGKGDRGSFFKENLYFV